MFGSKKLKYYAIFLKQNGQEYERYKRKKFDVASPEVHYSKDKSTIIDTNLQCYRDGLKRYFYVVINHNYEVEIETETGEIETVIRQGLKQIAFFEYEQSIDPEYVDLVLFKRGLLDLSSDLEGGGFKKRLENLIIGALIGGLGSALIFMFLIMGGILK